MMRHEKNHTKKARGMLSRAGYRAGGHVKHEDEKEDKALIKKEMKRAKIKLADGGCADGGKAKPRADKLARGGKPKKGSHVTVNVINAHGAPKPPVAMKPPMPMQPPGAMAGPPPGAGPEGPPMPPPGPMHRGGRAKKAKGGKTESQRDKINGMPMGHFKKGGRTRYPIKDGAGGGEGRLEKIKAYGA